MSFPEGITVRNALELDCFKGARVIAGHDGLDRIITGVNVMEVPDILPWVKENELLLTTGFSIKDDKDAQERLIPELAARGLAALGFKPKRYVDTIPEAMVEEANTQAFPIIEIPLSISHSQLLQGVYAELVVRQASLLRKTAKTHEAIMAVLLNGGGLLEIVSTLEEVVGNPVALFDTNGDLLTQSPGVQDLANSFSSLQLGTSKYRRQRYRPVRTFIETESGRVRVTMAPAIASNRVHGEIVVWESRRELAPLDVNAIETAASLVTLVILNQIAVRSVESRYCNEFLYDWLAGEFGSKEELIHRGSLVGWKLSESYFLMILDHDRAAEPSEQYGPVSEEIRMGKEACQQAITRILTARKDKYLLGDRGSHLVLLVQTSPALDETTVKETAEEIAELVHKEVSRHCEETSVSIGIGRFYRDLLEMPRCFCEAKKAVSIGRMLKGPGAITHFDNLGVYRLLHLIPDEQELAGFASETVAALLDYDAQYGTDLLSTLQAYFRCNGNVSKMARELFAHYNTVTYRLERIEAITGMSLNDPEQRLDLQIGLKIAMLRELS